MGPLEPRDLDDELRHTMDRIGRRMLSPGWTHQPRRARPHRKVKVRAGLYLHHWLQESSQGPVEARFSSLDGKVLELSLRGPVAKLPRETSEFIGGGVAELTKALSAMALKAGIDPAPAACSRLAGRPVPSLRPYYPKNP